MSLHDNLARIRQSDIDALTGASSSLAEAAGTIQRANPAWAPAVVQLLREANQAILAVRDRGLGRITRYLAKQQEIADAEEHRNKSQPASSSAANEPPRGWPGRGRAESE